MGMDNISEVSLLRIVTSAELELPFGSRAKMAMVVRQASFDNGPAHSKEPLGTERRPNLICGNDINDRR